MGQLLYYSLTIKVERFRRGSESSQSHLKARLNTKGSSNSGKHGNENLEHLAPERFLVFHESLEFKVESLEFREVGVSQSSRSPQNERRAPLRPFSYTKIQHAEGEVRFDEN